MYKRQVVYTRVEDNDNYDNIYQSDLCGWVGQLGYECDTAYFSNVYTAQSDEELYVFGEKAKDFVLEKKNSFEQAKRVIELIKL